MLLSVLPIYNYYNIIRLNMGNTLPGATTAGGMLKTMRDMVALGTGGSNDRDSSGYQADKLPDGEKYFGFVNVLTLITLY